MARVNRRQTASGWQTGAFATRKARTQSVVETEGPPVPPEVEYRQTLRWAADYGVPYTREDLVEAGHYTADDCDAARLVYDPAYVP